MIRLVIVDADGKPMKPAEIASATDLVSITEQARTVIRECQRLADEKRPKHAPGTGVTPYST
jgi:hypothetical protein